MLSSKRREKKKLDQKEQKSLLQGIEPESGVYHLQLRSIYVHIRSEISNTIPDIRRTEDTAYLRSYDLGQPYHCVAKIAPTFADVCIINGNLLQQQALVQAWTRRS